MASGYVATASDTAPKPVSPTRARWGSRATHVLIEKYLADGLRKLTERTRVTQAQYLREAVADVLEKHGRRALPNVAFHERISDELVSLVFRLDPEVMGRLVELSRRTRVRQSEYLREAIIDVLRKYDKTVPAPKQIRLPLKAGLP